MPSTKPSCSRPCMQASEAPREGMREAGCGARVRSGGAARGDQAGGGRVAWDSLQLHGNPPQLCKESSTGGGKHWKLNMRDGSLLSGFLSKLARFQGVLLWRVSEQL